MKIEISRYEQQFIIEFLQYSYLERFKELIEKLTESAVMHPDNDDYVECEITIYELEELVGELSYEANHSRRKRFAELSCEIAESLESQLYSEKCTMRKREENQAE